MARPLVLTLLLSFLTAAPADAAIVCEPVPYEHDGVALQGIIAYDDALPGRRPGVVVVHEWWGLADHPKQRARALAELGYVAFAIDMYGKGKLTRDPKEAAAWSSPFKDDVALARARARAGYQTLQGHERVDPERMAAVGFCFGGTIALQMAYDGLDLDAVVSFHGHPVSPREGDTIKASILVCHGAADAYVPQDMIDAFQGAMREREADWVWIAYGGAVHGFTNRDADRHGMKGVAYDAVADARSWDHMRLFLRQALGE